MELYIYGVQTFEVGTYVAPVNSEIPVTTFSFSGAGLHTCVYVCKYI
jgi:hypothetical protein